MLIVAFIEGKERIRNGQCSKCLQSIFPIYCAAIMSIKLANQAFIDAQNLYLGTVSIGSSWKVDLKRFRIYLAQKYHVSEAYYFLGTRDPKLGDMYTAIQKHGYILMFREHSQKMAGAKKGNVDTDIVFSVMRKLYKKELNKAVLVSGDGDYYRTVKFLIEEGRLEKILMPNKKYASSLYKSIPDSYKDYLDNESLRSKIEYKDRKQNAGSP